MHDYWNENTSNYIFNFPISFIEHEFQPIGFLAVPLLYLFYLEIQSNTRFNSIFSNIGWFSRKTIDAVLFSTIKNKSIYNFYAFAIKTDFRNMSEIREFRRKNKEKSSQSANFATSFSKNHCIYWKTKNANRFFYCKNKFTYIFHVFMIKKCFRKCVRN